MEIIFLLLCCLLSGFTIIVFGLVFIVSIRRRQPYSVQEIAQINAAADKFFTQTIPQLLPWNVSALAALSCMWLDPKGAALFRRNMGQVISINQKDHLAWLAFYYRLKGNNGLLRVRTSEREIRLQIDRDLVLVEVNNTPLGSLRMSDDSILDKSAVPIGRYQRFKGLRWQMGSRNLSPRYGTVDLNGRKVAEVNDALTWGKGWIDGGAEKRPLMRELRGDLTPEEENWLLALVGMELYYDALRSRAYVTAGRPIR